MFCVKNHPNISDFFSLNDINLRAHLLINSILKKIPFSKMLPNFRQPLCLFTKYNNFEPIVPMYA